MTPIRLAPEVPAELEEAVRWYEGRRAGLGHEFLDAVATVLPLIGDRPRSFPLLGSVRGVREIRRALVGRFPFAIVFQVMPAEIRVLAIAHTKRKPGYWLDRA